MLASFMLQTLLKPCLATSTDTPFALSASEVTGGLQTDPFISVDTEVASMLHVEQQKPP